MMVTNTVLAPSRQEATGFAADSFAALRRGVRPILFLVRSMFQEIRVPLCPSVAHFVAFSCCLAVGTVTSAEPKPVATPLKASLREPTPIEDDANLHDVQFIGSRRGWAVGDHGVIWHSDDGGENWVLQASGVTCPLHSVSFLSDRVGWIAGGGTVPFTRRSYGVVLVTSDGGQTWNSLIAPPAIVATSAERRQPAPPPTAETKAVTAKTAEPKGGAKTLPRIRKIKFFSLDEGVAVGEGAGTDPSGVYTTEDGGKSWRAMTGKASPGWLGGEFFSPEAGILVGVRDSLGIALERTISTPRFERFGTRSRHAIALDRERSGWLVGDGGLVLRTENDGLVWQAPPRPLPAGIRETFDFRTVCLRDGHVWVAGNPGSTIWHSPDAGQSWQMQRTGQTVPLAKLDFTSAERGWGVGALGTVLRTSDGGRTWNAVRGQGRRAALLSLYGRMGQVSLGLIAEMSAELGYRSLVSVVARDEEHAEGVNDAEASDRLHEAVTRSGGSVGQMGWQLPLAIPGLDRDLDRLVAEWNRRTENRLDEVLIGALVRQLRTWRPNVLIIDDPETGGPVAQLIGEAAKQAVERAADSTSFLEHQDLAGLDPWQVQKIFVRLPNGNSGQVNIEPFHFLPHVGETTNNVAATAEALFHDDQELTIRRESYKLLGAPDEKRTAEKRPDEKRPATSRESTATAPKLGNGPGGLFAGISLPTGGPARRALSRFDDSNLEARQKAIQKMRNFAVYSEKMLDDQRRAGQLIAQLPDLSRGLSDSDAAWQLMHLAERYQETGQWELGELTLIELMERYPDQPAGLRAVQRLMQAWGSNEVTWRRLKKSSTEVKRHQTRPDRSVPAAIEFAEARLQKQSQKINRTVFNSDDDEPEDLLDNDTVTPSGGGTAAVEKRVTHRDLARKQRYWRTRAFKLFAELSRRDPALAADPAIQFSLASLYRQRTLHLKAEEIYQRFANGEAGTPWAQAASGEIWMTNVANPPTSPITRCRFSPARPVLDGVLLDACWENGFALPLKAAPQSPDEGAARAYVCYDAEHLYFAARLPRVEGVRTDGSIEGQRRHDEDLSDFDRVVLSLDVDRDYVSSFNLAVDQRGCTHDSCWYDESWNPRWFVSVMGDAAEWRVEAAIPLDELAPYIPGKGVVWSLGVTRIVPAVGLESWSHPASAAPRPETFGLMRFDPPGAMK
jgi:photosystem II stability/assembly factor-like uncharacterized protein